MKKNTAIRTIIAFALGLSLLSNGALLASSCKAAPGPAAKSKEGGSSSWIDDGLRWVKETYNTSKDAVKDGTQRLLDNIKDWSTTVQEYLEKGKSSPEVLDALNTLKNGAQHAGEVTEEALTEAYNTLRSWMQDTGEDVDEEAASALDQMASAAGVKEAKNSEWVRDVESYLSASTENIPGAITDAWEMLKEASTEGTKIAKEKLAQAYASVHDWLEMEDGDSSEAAEEALESIFKGIEEER